MLAGLIAVTLWRIFVMQYVNIDSILPGVFCNCIFLFGSHYFLKEDGGWVCTKNSNNEYTEKNTYFSILKNKIKEIIFYQKNIPFNKISSVNLCVFSEYLYVQKTNNNTNTKKITMRK